MEYFRPERKGAVIRVYWANLGALGKSQRLKLIWEFFFFCLLRLMFEYLGNISWTVLSEITQIRRAGDKQAAVGGRAAPTYVPIQTVAYTHYAGTSVCNKPISSLRVHARARAAQGYALAQKSKSRRTVPRFPPPLLT